MRVSENRVLSAAGGRYNCRVDRRTLIKQGGLAVLGLGVGACAPKTALQTTPASPRRPPLVLPVVNAAWDRVIRTTIGLRPHRPGGFVLRAEKLDAKTVVHNYGHGGAGWSLSWGTAAMAVELALPHETRRAAVLGAGIVGLTTARELQRHGFEVTVYAAELAPDTTSNKALAGFTPTSGLSQSDARTPAWIAQLQRAVDIAYRRHQLMVGPKYGVSWIMNYAPTDNEQAGRGTNTLLPESAQGAREILGPGEHPFPAKFCIARPEMRFEPSIYLDALLQDFALFGGRTVVRRFDNARELVALPESLIVNCTGLGAKTLFADKELVPLKGQLTVLVPQPEIQYGTSGGNRVQTAEPGLGIHMMPRSDGIILGGTSERDVWTMDVNESERRRIVEGHIELFDWMRAHNGGKPAGARQT
jgi:glycine/D-amino acid oxidase-like deaminating enzyme